MPTLKFRQDTVRSIPYQGPGGKHQCVYWDVALEGFGLRVYPSGRRVYVCSYRVRRRKRLATLGRADVLTLDQARKKAIAYLGKVASHEDPQDEIHQHREHSSKARVASCCERRERGHRAHSLRDWYDAPLCCEPAAGDCPQDVQLGQGSWARPSRSCESRRWHRAIPAAQAEAIHHDRRDASFPAGVRAGRQRLCEAWDLASAPDGFA